MSVTRGQLRAIALRIKRGEASCAEEARTHGIQYLALRRALAAAGYVTRRPKGTGVPKFMHQVAALRSLGMTVRETAEEMHISKSYAARLDGLWLEYLKRILGEQS